jgi:hypothetical protein
LVERFAAFFLVDFFAFFFLVAFFLVAISKSLLGN